MRGWDQRKQAQASGEESGGRSEPPSSRTDQHNFFPKEKKELKRKYGLWFLAAVFCAT